MVDDNKKITKKFSKESSSVKLCLSELRFELNVNGHTFHLEDHEQKELLSLLMPLCIFYFLCIWAFSFFFFLSFHHFLCRVVLAIAIQLFSRRIWVVQELICTFGQQQEHISALDFSSSNEKRRRKWIRKP